jgi:predicted nuclease of restriction endonuclease-like (RecB) superfamily
MNPTIAPSAGSTRLYRRIRGILESARSHAVRSVNSAQVVSNWLVGREIVEEEQRGADRAAYGSKLLDQLSRRLTRKFGRGYSRDNLEAFRLFYLGYPGLISETVSRKFPARSISETVSRKSSAPLDRSVMTDLDPEWTTGRLHPNLAWSIYRHLLKVGRKEARAFYEIEAIKNSWSARELERQVSSLLFERLMRSRDKRGLMRLATKGQEVVRPTDVFKDPVVMEFLDLPQSEKLVEADVEQALISNLQAFLLELGKGFAFVSRQERISIDSDHFYIDLVFYHTVLKCYVLIDLKVGKLNHADLGQLQLYVNYFDRARRTRGDKPTVGLVLCTDKNDAVVQYTLGPNQHRRIFARQYKLHLPDPIELQARVQRVSRGAAGPGPSQPGVIELRPDPPAPGGNRAGKRMPRAGSRR